MTSAASAIPGPLSPQPVGVSSESPLSKSPVPPQSPSSATFGHVKQDSQSNGSGAIPRDINMCSKTSLQTFTYNYPWEQTVSSYMLRFPKNHLMPVLLGSEVIGDSFDAALRCRTIVRKCFIDIEAPQWVKRAIGADHIEVTQTTTVDAANRKMRILNFNETFKDKAVFGDDCTFGVDDADPNKTVFRQYGFFSLPKLPLAKVCEKIMCKTYEKHSAEGRNIDLAFLQEAVDTGFWRDLQATGTDCVLRMLLENPKLASPASPILHSTSMAGDEDGAVDLDGQKKPEVMSTLSLPEAASSVDNGGIRASTAAILSPSNAYLNGSQQQLSSADATVESYMAAYIDLIWGSVAVALLPTALSLRGTIIIALFTLVSAAILFSWHCAKHLDFWVFVLNRLTDEKQQISMGRPHGRRKFNNKSPTNSNANLVTPANAPMAPSVQRLNTSSSAQQPDASEDESALEEDVETSEKTGGQAGESDTDSVEEEDYSEGENGEYESQILSGEADTVDDNLGDLNECALKDIQVSIPAFIEKLSSSGDDYEFVVEVIFPNGAHRTVERLYSDFARIQVLFYKKLPNYKIRFEKTYLPKRGSNPVPLGMALDQRRLYLQSYLRSLLADEVIGKSATRIMIEFLKRRGQLFPPRNSLASTAKKRFIKAASAAVTSSTLPADGTASVLNGEDFKTGVLLLLQWRSGLKEVRLTFDKSTGFLNLNTKGLRGVDSIIHLEDIEHLTSHYYGASANNSSEKPKVPFGRDKYGFLELKMINKDSYILCGSKELIQQWTEELSLSRDSAVKNVATSSLIPAHINAPRRKPSDLSDFSVVLNRKRIILTGGSGDCRTDPCELAVSLLRSALSIFQEYTDAQYIKTPKIAKKLEKFTEQCCELQIIDLDSLQSHERTLSFFANVYHTLVIHAYLEMEVVGMKVTPKRVRNILKNACYDISNFLFSVQDIEHSVLRAKMSHPVVINNPLFAQIPSPTFKRHDPRSRWTLQKADMRIDFILNSGVKSSIYNVWIFSSDAAMLNIQMDHATTHYLNEQVTVDNGRTTLYLPRVCQYFAKDFGGSKQATVKALIPYLSAQIEREIKYMLRIEQNGGNKIKIRYDDYEWTLRGLFFRGHDVAVNNYYGCQLRPNRPSSAADPVSQSPQPPPISPNK